MTIHKEGYKTLILLLIVMILFVLGANTFLISSVLGRRIILFSCIGLYLFILMFFRNPNRSVEINEKLIYASADGNIVAIEEVEEDEFFNEKRIQVSVFMTIFDIHMNSFPISGRIKYMKYHPGKNLIAFLPKSSQLNEMSSVVIENENGIGILVRQIAGALARRIVTYPKPGDNVKQGDELGFIKFGSRVDLFLPIGTKINVDIGQRVKGKKSVIAEFAEV
ncbi:MAG: phosphatidylserine decarboxylase family protein [Bacteroidales bacterium]|nr:phosphatidylserine decarboxylase family protein [Bacteroidales bacterium]